MLVLQETIEKGPLSDDERACMRARYRRTTNVKLVDLLAFDANRDRSGRRWNHLLAWHFDLTGSDSATLTAGAATFLSETGSAEEAMRYADLALGSIDNLRAPKGTVYKLYTLRVGLARTLFDQATAANQFDPSQESFVEVQTAKGRVLAYQMALDEYCTQSKGCPRGWKKK
jgi:hypothetical protein